ncbi:GTPase domain-containing protein [Wohlfahrtiimonas chitiniclastica]|uniref:GTPase n=1 Tax=Wohlfahrtiimonas chitiniclastica TaxID=400946 RepID=UPI0007BE7A2C|nr:GTPase domain-containing protein [Wohlfahrtiimonas chitiniclastica]KZS22826.1 hypothetical protein BMY_0656 [Wohlfahrtiimonas chitiniclastica]MDC7252934.1 hypothetical protein [Wohlfahrtiimonas chitiniclastica]WHR55273.1 GTPase domain-containing protein [Wohlfahrtiimonas chitiniclastica]
MENTGYNIAIIGQTGVGKSSLINYLFGANVAAAGIGKPVTANGFHEYNYMIKGMTVKIYDSWGLEVDKEDKWQNDLDEELKKRGIDKPASEWFHSVFYCISAASARLQEVDCAIIRKLISKNYKVSVVLTKADTLSEDDEIEFIKVIAEELGKDVAIIPVCSEHKKTRAGETLPFGKEMIEKQSLIDLIDSLVTRIPLHSSSVMKKILEAWETQQYNKVNDQIGWFGSNASELKDELSKSMTDIIHKITQEGEKVVKKSLEEYKFIADHIKKQLHVSDDYKYNSYAQFDFYANYTSIPLVFLVGLPFYMINLWGKISGQQYADEIKRDIRQISKTIMKNIEDKEERLRMSLLAAKQSITGDDANKKCDTYIVDFILIGSAY